MKDVCINCLVGDNCHKNSWCRKKVEYEAMKSKTVWFTSDTHYRHQRIIEYVNRPFETSNQMDNIIINNYNELVKPDDTVYFLGDFSIKGIIHINDLWNIAGRLNGRKHLIMGSHDYLHPWDYIKIGFETVHTFLEIEIEGVELYLFHDPAIATGLLDKVCICGHVHNLFKTLNNVINVGVDVWDFKPVSFEQIKELIPKGLNKVEDI